ncbi:MAG: corrinoid protein [Candidatus Tectomicrobia bacterium]|uniref:Corrinoid protein n=1 Tax=Tectimicrobiota bacterium TaxID=2528274 RepID=A0A933GKU1_UNCTE|nr:corrinoid protein [Candidatus Tectomicrobia bacterium]
MSDFFSILTKAVRDGDHKQVVETLKKALQSGFSAIDLLEKGLVPGMRALGDSARDGTIYLPEILISIRAMNMGVEELKPLLAGVNISKRGTIVIGTAAGDIHDIGKNLVKLMLSSNGFEVVDLGVDVSADSFASAAQQHKAHIVAVSALLTTTITSFPTIVGALQKAGLKNKVRVMVGGAPVTRAYADQVGAEGFAEDCISAVDEAARLMAL